MNSSQTSSSNSNKSSTSSANGQYSQHNSQGNGQLLNPGDILRDSIMTAVSTVLRSMEPQIHDFATHTAEHAVDRAGDLTQAALRRVRAQPWYLVGAAAILLVGAAVMIGFEASEGTQGNARKSVNPGAMI